MSVLASATERLRATALRQTHLKHTIGVSIFRVLTGLTLIYEHLIVYAKRHELFGIDALYTREEFLESAPPWSLYRLVETNQAFELLYHASVVVLALWTAGLKTRWLTPLVWLIWSSLQSRAPMLWDGGHNLVSILLVYACFLDLSAKPGEVCRGVRGIAHNTAITAFAIQVCIVYFVAGIMKARGSTWLTGSALYFSLADEQFAWSGIAQALYSSSVLLGIIGPLTILFQVGFPFFYFLNATSRVLILAVAVAFHVSIGLVLGLISFAVLFIAAELALVRDDEYAKLGAWFQEVRSRLTRGSSRARKVQATYLGEQS